MRLPQPICTLLSRLHSVHGQHASLTALLTPSSHPFTVRKARIDVILTRTRAAAALLAVLTLAWIPIDAMAFDWPLWGVLAAGRIVAGIGFALVALNRRVPGGIERARLELAALFAIPAAFFLFAYMVLGGLPQVVQSLPVLTAYVHLPFLVIAGLAIFPLTAVESAGFGLLLLLAAAFAVRPLQGPGVPAFQLGGLWLLTLIGAVAAIAAMSQLRYLIVLTEQSTRDTLTRLLNRRVGEEMLELEFEISRRAGTPLSLVFVDLDGFKAVNDGFGHEAGDAVLQKAAAALVSGVRQQDMVIRWGGEEFMIVLPNTDECGARQMLWRLGVAGLGRRPDGRMQTASIGVSERQQDRAESWMRLIEIADRRMYEAKQAGRNRCTGPGGVIIPFLSRTTPGAPRQVVPVSATPRDGAVRHAHDEPMKPGSGSAGVVAR